MVQPFAYWSDYVSMVQLFAYWSDYVSMVQLFAYWSDYVSMVQLFAYWSDYVSMVQLFAYWRDYVSMVQLFLLFFKAESSGDWLLHLSAIAAMTPHFFLTDRPNYSRWLLLYLADLNELSETHPVVNGEFMSGNHAISRSTQPFAQVTQVVLVLTKKSAQKRVERDEDDVRKLLTVITSELMTDPFSMDKDDDGISPLVNIATDAADAAARLLNSSEIGTAQITFVEQRLYTNEKGVYKSCDNTKRGTRLVTLTHNHGKRRDRSS
ncbi:hypothetical protein LSAT2_000704 [Lamellibrachia satsuma]|nr:hypothetical protein LSAT2_000704 [Lamellibrachia satsuma]